MTGKLLRRKQFGVEILPTEHACGLHTFLLSEGRHVAAALMPCQRPLQLNTEEAHLYSKKVHDAKWEQTGHVFESF